MEEQTKTFVDPSRTQEVQQTNPIEKNRQPTDRLFIFLFLLVIISWLVAIISGFSAEQKSTASDIQKLQILLNTPFSSFPKAFIELSFTMIMTLVLTTGFMLFGAFLNGKFTKFFVYFGMGIYMLGAISNCAKYIAGFKTVSDDTYRNISRSIPPAILVPMAPMTQTWFLIQTIFLIVSAISFLKVDQKVLFGIIKDLNRFILGSPSIILFTILISVLEYLVFSVSMNAMLSGLASERSIYRRVPESLMLIFGGLSIMSFVYYFSVMVISECTVNYYWKNDDISVLSQCISKTLRNHIGTIMFSSTLFVPFICAIVQALKHNRSWKHKENYIFYFLTKVSLVLDMEYIALIFSSIYGTGFVKSSKKTFDTLLHHCILYLATFGVIAALLVMMIIITTILMAIVFGLLTAFNMRLLTNPLGLTSALYGFIVPIISFAMLMNASASALLINKAIISNKEEKYTEGKADILDRL